MSVCLKSFERGNTNKNNLTTQNQKNIVYNYSTYSLSGEQYIALSYGLDTNISSGTNANI